MGVGETDDWIYDTTFYIVSLKIIEDDSKIPSFHFKLFSTRSTHKSLKQLPQKKIIIFNNFYKLIPLRNWKRKNLWIHTTLRNRQTSTPRVQIELDKERWRETAQRNESRREENAYPLLSS